MTQQGCDRFEGHAAVDGLGGKGMPELVGRYVPYPAVVAALVTARSTREALMRRPRSVNKNSDRKQLERPEGHSSRRVLS